MDSILETSLRKWHSQIEVLQKVEEKYYLKAAGEKSMEGRLYIASEGKTIDERRSQAYDSPDWRQYQTELATARAKYNHEKRMLDLKVKSYEAEYCTFKLENEAIRKGTGGAP